MYMCIVSNTYHICRVRIEYVSYQLLTVLSQPLYKGKKIKSQNLLVYLYLQCLLVFSQAKGL